MSNVIITDVLVRQVQSLLVVLQDITSILMQAFTKKLSCRVNARSTHRQLVHQRSICSIKHPISSIKSAASPIDICANSYQIKSKNQTGSTSSLGTAYLYADADTGLGQHSLLGEYGNGSASSTGRTEYIWLPTEDANTGGGSSGGAAIPVGMYRGSKFYAIHTDHLGTPRLITDNTNAPVWQWAYSAFGDNAPTGVLKPTTNAANAYLSIPATAGGGTNTATLLAVSNPTQVFNLRFPGQFADTETGNFYNYFRNYQPNQGRYTQGDPIGLAGGLNRFGYVEGSPLSMTDPFGLQAATAAGSAGGLGGLGGLGSAAGGSRGGYDPRTDTYTPVPNISIPGFLKPDECPPENNCDKLNDDVQRAKDKVGKFQPAACSSSMSKLELLARSSAWLELAVARAKRDQKCWAGGDAGHQQAQADAWKNLGRCQGLLR